MTTTLDRFRQVCRDRHAYARAWKERTGGQVLGYFCTYAPEEILDAAGVLPVRILGSHEPSAAADPSGCGTSCHFSRDCLSQALHGRYEYLDGTTVAQTCDQIRSTFRAWQTVQPRRFHEFLPLPIETQGPRTVDDAARALSSFRSAVEKWVGQAVTDAAIRESIEVYNESRRLLRRLYDFRRLARPALSGREAMEVVLAAQLMDKREHNELLRRLIGELPERLQDRDPGVRLMIVGSEDDDTEFLGLTEDLGATVVIDEHCTGTRYFMNLAPVDGDPIRALAARYVGKPPCPTRQWDRALRDRHALALAREWGVEGALFLLQKFCDPRGLDTSAVKSALEKDRVPTLYLEFDGAASVDRFRTRIEAFLKTIRAENPY